MARRRKSYTAKANRGKADEVFLNNVLASAGQRRRKRASGNKQKTEGEAATERRASKLAAEKDRLAASLTSRMTAESAKAFTAYLLKAELPLEEMQDLARSGASSGRELLAELETRFGGREDYIPASDEDEAAISWIVLLVISALLFAVMLTTWNSQGGWLTWLTGLAGILSALALLSAYDTDDYDTQVRTPEQRTHYKQVGFKAYLKGLFAFVVMAIISVVSAESIAARFDGSLFGEDASIMPGATPLAINVGILVAGLFHIVFIASLPRSDKLAKGRARAFKRLRRQLD